MGSSLTWHPTRMMSGFRWWASSRILASRNGAYHCSGSSRGEAYPHRKGEVHAEQGGVVLGADLAEGVSGFLEAPPQCELQGELPLLGAGAENSEHRDVDGAVPARPPQQPLDLGVADHRVGDPQIAAPCFGVQVCVLPRRDRQEAEDVQPRGQGPRRPIPGGRPACRCGPARRRTRGSGVSAPLRAAPQLRGDADPDRGQPERLPGVPAGQPLSCRVGNAGLSRSRGAGGGGRCCAFPC